jgi:hypothetical protein
VSIKSWSCPGCHRDFIVDAESVRDTCPWCNATVEEKSGHLQIVTESEKPAEAAATASAETSSSSSGAAGSGTGNSGTQSWWPFEYSS